MRCVALRCVHQIVLFVVRLTQRARELCCASACGSGLPNISDRTGLPSDVPCGAAGARPISAAAAAAAALIALALRSAHSGIPGTGVESAGGCLFTGDAACCLRASPRSSRACECAGWIMSRRKSRACRVRSRTHLSLCASTLRAYLRRALHAAATTLAHADTAGALAARLLRRRAELGTGTHQAPRSNVPLVQGSSGADSPRERRRSSTCDGHICTTQPSQ